jgi:rubrerythrin
MYKAVMDAIEKRIQTTTKNDLGVDCISRQELLDEINNYRQIERKQLNEIIKNMPSVTPQLSVPEVTALAEWTEKLTKECEEAYNKGYEAGMKAQEPRKGHWIRVTDKAGHLVWECDKCGWQQRFNTNYCPDCGSYNGGASNVNE